MTRVILVKRTTVIAATAATLLLLAGCSGTTQEGVTLTSEPVGLPAATVAAPPTSAAPLAAQTPEASVDGREAAFLAEVRAELRPDNVIPDATDAQLLSAGADACEQLKTAETSNSISVIEGEPQNGVGGYSDSATIVTAARAFLCD